MSSRELTSVADAEAEAEGAQARAAAARARAILLRQLAGESSNDELDLNDALVRDSAGEVQPALTRSARILARMKLNQLRHNGIIFSVATVLIGASLVLSSLMLWHHHTFVQHKQRAEEFATAAKRAVIMLMSIDPNHAEGDLQRVIDNSTGDFKAQLEVTAKNLATAFEQSKIGTKATVQAVAVESTSDNSGVVLVAAKSEVTNADSTKQPPGSWRLSVTLDRDGGQLKLSRLEFVQ